MNDANSHDFDTSEPQRLELALADAVARVIEADNHSWSQRPCPSCRTITGLLARPFGCNAYALARARARFTGLDHDAEDEYDEVLTAIAKAEPSP